MIYSLHAVSLTANRHDQMNGLSQQWSCYEQIWSIMMLKQLAHFKTLSLNSWLRYENTVNDGKWHSGSQHHRRPCCYQQHATIRSNSSYCCAASQRMIVATATEEQHSNGHQRSHLQIAAPFIHLTKVCCVCCVVSFPKFHYDDMLPTCCGLVGRVASKSATVHNKLATSRLTGKLWGNVGNGFWALCHIITHGWPWQFIFLCSQESAPIVTWALLTDNSETCAPDISVWSSFSQIITSFSPYVLLLLLLLLLLPVLLLL